MTGEDDGLEDVTWMLDRLRELRRTEGDLAVAVHEAVRARTELRSEAATSAELRRQLAGTGALLGDAEGKLRAVLDLCDDPVPRHWREGAVLFISEVRAALGGATRTERDLKPSSAEESPR